jgi:hypothetical protein
MTNFIKVVTLIIAVSNGGFVLGNIGTDKDLSDSNSIFNHIEEASSKIIVEEDKESLKNATLILETVSIPEPVSIPEEHVSVYYEKSKKGSKYHGYEPEPAVVLVPPVPVYYGCGKSKKSRYYYQPPVVVEPLSVH